MLLKRARCWCLKKVLFYRVTAEVQSRDSSVGIALGYGLDDRGLGFGCRRGLGKFLFTTASRTALGPTQPPIQWVPGVFSLGVKRLGREADHSPPPSAEVKNAWSYTSTSQYVFMVWCLVRHRDTLTFTAEVQGFDFSGVRIVSLEKHCSRMRIILSPKIAIISKSTLK
jgi:hypothetical protein